MYRSLLVGSSWWLMLFLLATSLRAESYVVDSAFRLRLPEGLSLGAVSGVAVDSKGHLIVGHRGPRPVLVFDHEGHLLHSFGDAEISAVHGVRVDRDDHVWVTDYRNHTVLKYSAAGNLLMTLGKRDKPGSDDQTFNRATDVAVAHNGNFFVSDGYGNNRVIKFSPRGEFLKSWGTKGRAADQLNLPHAIQLDANERVLVADRENDRIQIYDQEGKLLESLTGMAPFGMCPAPDQSIYVADGRANKCWHLASDGRVLSEWGSQGSEPGQFRLPHCITVAEDGSIYVGEVDGKRLQRFLRREN